jgi:hypothetical protein
VCLRGLRPTHTSSGRCSLMKLAILGASTVRRSLCVIGLSPLMVTSIRIPALSILPITMWSGSAVTGTTRPPRPNLTQPPLRSVAHSGAPGAVAQAACAGPRLTLRGLGWLSRQLCPRYRSFPSVTFPQVRHSDWFIKTPCFCPTTPNCGKGNPYRILPLRGESKFYAHTYNSPLTPCR